MAEAKAEGVEQADESVLLTIIVRTDLKDDFCYLGIDSKGRVKRPIYRQELTWNKDRKLVVGQCYRFTLAHNNIQTELPHSNEDIVVTSQILSSIDMNYTFDLYAALDRLATEFHTCLFGGHMRGNVYVVPGTNCPSVGVLKVDGSTIKMKNYNAIVEIPIDGKACKFPYTGHDPLMSSDYDGYNDYNVMVVFSLQRPDKSSKKCQIFVQLIVKSNI